MQEDGINREVQSLPPPMVSVHLTLSHTPRMLWMVFSKCDVLGDKGHLLLRYPQKQHSKKSYSDGGS